MPVAMTSPVEEVDRPVGPWKKRHCAAPKRRDFSSTTASRLTGVVFQWLDQRTATQIVT